MNVSHISNEAMDIANNIINYLGSNKVRAMLGNNFIVSSKGNVTFKFKCGKLGINCCVIIYNPNEDLYDMTFYKIKGVNCEKMVSVNSVFGEQLKDVFENHTGLFLSL